MASVFDKFHGIRPMAAKLGVPPSTVKSWHANRHIPAWRHAAILEAAARLGIDLAPEDLELGSAGPNASDQAAA